MINFNESYFTLVHLANETYKNNFYVKSKWYYECAILEAPELEKIYLFNIKMLNTIFIEKKIEKLNYIYEVIIPVFNALDDLKKCLYSIESTSNYKETRIIFINDGSNKKTTDWLREQFWGKENIFLIENQKNIGYTKSINRGLKLSTSPYSIILNSDTIVSDRWLKKMKNIMENDRKIGIVGPLSNAATWQNIPILKDENNKFIVNKLPKNLSIKEMSSFVEKHSLYLFPKIELLNGFCMLIGKKVIEEIGYMDEELFPLGYGEEIEYCIRSKEAGFDLVIADNVYVYHSKSKSFGNALRLKLSENGEKAIKYKYGHKKYMDIKKNMETNNELLEIRLNIQEKLHKRNIL